MPELPLLDQLARSIDEADEFGDHSALRQAFASLESIDKSRCEPIERATIDYYLANALAGLRKINEQGTYWDWSQPYLEREIFHYRLALNELPAEEGTDFLKSRIITNLANALNHAGRFVEGIELWNQVLDMDDNFGMALANKGNAFFWYAKYAQSTDDQLLILRDSHRHLFKALSTGVEDHVAESIRDLFKHVSSMADWSRLKVEQRPYPESVAETERQYRNWCKMQCLFLSPLNDLDSSLEIEDIRDTLTLPSIVVSATEGSAQMPVVYGMFNQAKQEYTSARYLVYEAIQEREQDLHFADRGVVLYDALDRRLYRLWVERMKMAFLAVHAILDKLAYLMNSYWKLGLKSREVSFSGIWYSKGKKQNDIAPRFQAARNWPLKGLYWLSKDFYDNPDAKGNLAPEPRMLQEIRNHIAHKYLRVHDHIVTHLRDDRIELTDDFGYQVTDDELQTYTIKLLRLVRSSMIYLTAAVLQEEIDKKKGVKDELITSMPVFSVGDDYRL